MSSLSINSQMRYLVQWFKEWSELERSDFLKVLSECCVYGPTVNGIANNISTMNCQDKPMSLFQCRIKLFKEWYNQWELESKEEFYLQLGAIDPEFIDRVGLGAGRIPPYEPQDNLDHSNENGNNLNHE